MPSVGSGDRAKLRCKAAAAVCSQVEIQPRFFALFPEFGSPSLLCPKASGHCCSFSL